MRVRLWYVDSLEWGAQVDQARTVVFDGELDVTATLAGAELVQAATTSWLRVPRLPRRMTLGDVIEFVLPTGVTVAFYMSAEFGFTPLQLRPDGGFWAAPIPVDLP